MLHYAGHFLAPFPIARAAWREAWLRAALVMLAANAIDLDHLMATPMFDPGRCSLGFHPLHDWIAGLVYMALLAVPRWWTRALGLGCLWHLGVDGMDCLATAALA